MQTRRKLIVKLAISSEKLASISSSPPKPGARAITRVRWGDGGKERVVALRREYPDWTWKRFQETYYPERTVVALQSVWTEAKMDTQVEKRVAARTTSASAKRRAPPVVVDSTDYESSLSADIDPSGQFTPSPAIKKTRVESPRTSDIWEYPTLSATAIVTAFDTLDGERNVELTPSQPPPPQPLLPSSPPSPPSLTESRAAAAPVIDSRITNISSNVSLTGNKSVSPARPLATRQQMTGQRESSTIAPNGQSFALALPENTQPVCNATGEAFHGLAEDSVTIVDDMPKHSMRQKYSQADSRQHAERSMIGSCTVINMAIRQMGEAERKIEKELPCLLEKYNLLQEDNIRCGEQNARLREVKEENIKYQKENEMLKLENERMKTAAQRFYEAHNMPQQNACPDQVLT